MFFNAAFVQVREDTRLNIQAMGRNMNDYNVRSTENYVNPDLEFSSYLNQTMGMKNSDITLSNKKVQANNNYASNYQSSTFMFDTCWDDKTFADMIMKFKKVTIRTDKPINWGTTGEHQLTADEIDTLKNRYDVANLSEQDFYDLMADLSNLNAIKPEDIISEYCSKGDGMEWYSTLVEMNYPILDKWGKVSYLARIHEKADYFKVHGEMINSAEFMNSDKFLLAQKQNPQYLSELKASVQERYEEANRYFRVIAQLVRDPRDLMMDTKETDEIKDSLLSEKKEKLSFLETLQERADYYKAYSEMLNNAEFLKLSKSLFAPKPNPQLLLELEANAQERYEMA